MFPTYRLFVVAVAGGVGVLLWLLNEKTLIGARLRAAVDDPEMASGTGINVAAVSTAFPHGLAPLSTRLAEIEASVADGANEIDIVIERGMVLRGDWQALYDEVRAMRKACGDAQRV